jgi:hypothetical protein
MFLTILQFGLCQLQQALFKRAVTTGCLQLATSRPAAAYWHDEG